MGTFFRSRQNFTRYVWLALAYVVLVILWGAVVRATGSGAGCGSHWPLCNGVVVPRAPQVETLIELTHRLTSAFSGVVVIGLVVWAFRLFAKGHTVRKWAVLSMVFILTEGALGASLVLFEWVAHNASVARAISMALHLVNTFLLLAAITLTAWAAGETYPGERSPRLRGQGRVGWLIGLGLLLLVLLGASGAVTALGDTLFPAGSLSEGISQDFLPTAHFLVRLRIYHPIIAILTSVYLVVAGAAVAVQRPGPDTRRFARAVKFIVVIQLAAGFINVLLLAPVWMQVVHLLLADLLWIAAILLAAAALAEEAPVGQVEALMSVPGD